MRKNVYHQNPYIPVFYNRIVKLPVFSFCATDKQSSFVNWLSVHAPLNIFMFLFIIATFCFGPGYQPIAFLFVPGIISLVGYTRSAPSGYVIPCIAFPAMAIGIFFGYAGSFSNSGPWDNPDTVYMIPVALLYAGMISIALLLDRGIAGFSMLMLHFIEVFFAFPMIWAGLWTLINRVSPFGDFGNWGFATALMGLDAFTLGITWLFGAIAGGAYAFGMIVSSSLYISRRFLEIYYPSRQDENIAAIGPDAPSVSTKQLMSDRTEIRVFFFHPISFMLYIAAVVYGFGNIYATFAPAAQMFYQNPISYWAPDTVQMSCLVNASLASTEDHLKTSGIESKFVVWSENSVDVYDQDKFLATAMELSEKYNVYLGLSYKYFDSALITSSNGKYSSKSMFTLIVPPNGSNVTSNKATIGFTYQKSRLVPGVENHIQPSPDRHVPYIESPYGRIGAAIGMDFDYPSIEEAYRNQVAIMIQPAWNWGATGVLHSNMNRLRAVENGFTLFRCARNGISGVFDPFYSTLIRQITLDSSDWFAYRVPLFGHRWTLYSLMYDYLGIACMAVFTFWLLFLPAYYFFKFYRGRNPRIRRRPSEII